MKNSFDRILIRSDLLTTRATVAISSLIFAFILFTHYMTSGHWHYLFWVTISLIHSLMTFWSLVKTRSINLHS